MHTKAPVRSCQYPRVIRSLPALMTAGPNRIYLSAAELRHCASDSLRLFYAIFPVERSLSTRRTTNPLRTWAISPQQDTTMVKILRAVASSIVEVAMLHNHPHNGVEIAICCGMRTGQYVGFVYQSELVTV